MKKSLLTVVLIIAVAVLGVKGFIYYKVTSQLDEAIAAINPFARITYQDVSSTLQGEITVEGVKIRSYGVDLSLAIDAVTIAFPDLKTLLFINDDLARQRMPKNMRVEVSHMRLKTDALAPFMATAQAGSESIFRDYSLLGCGDLASADPLTVLRQLGFNELDSSMEMGYRWDKHSKRLALDMDFLWHDMSSSAINIQVDNFAALSAAALVNEPELKTISITIQDQGYNARVIEHCATSQNISQADFIKIHLAMLKATLNEQGITLSENLFDAYRYYLNAEGPLEIQMRPASMQNLANIAMFKPRDLPDLLGLEIRMADQVIRDIEIDWDQQQFQQLLIAMQRSEEVPAQTWVEPVVKEQTRPVYVAINYSQLATKREQIIRVTTSDQRTFEGALVSMDPQKLRINVAMAGGYATLPIKRIEVERVELRIPVSEH